MIETPKSINVIGDIAGNMRELERLIKKMPKADLILSVGDLVDRGPDSNRVIEYFMDDPFGKEALHANHENMMLEALLTGNTNTMDIWLYNGGMATWKAYKGDIPPEHLIWLANRPMWYKEDGLFASHAPVAFHKEIPAQYADWRDFTITKHLEDSFIWYRKPEPREMPGHHMIFGHNSRFKEHKFFDFEGNEVHYATCIDNSRGRPDPSLMGLHWPSREIFSEELQ